MDDAMPAKEQATYRRIGPLLMLGLLLCPAIFAWLLLRRGYANSTRVAFFAYGLFMMILSELGRI